jgi:hypothetical protein
MPEWSEKTISKQLKLYNDELKSVSGVMLLLDIGNEPGKAKFHISLPSFGNKTEKPKKPAEIETNNNNLLKIVAGVISLTLIAAVVFVLYKFTPLFGENKPNPQTQNLQVQENATTTPVAEATPEQATSSTPFFEIADESVKATGLVFANDKLVLYSAGNKNIWRLDFKEKKLESIATEANVKFLDIQQNIPFLLTSDNLIFKYDLVTNKLSKVQPVKLDGKAIITGFTVYTSKFYLLDSFNGRILRATGGNTGDWLAANTRKPTGAKSLAIDKSLWILTKNNDLDRYFENSYKETIKPAISPALQNPVKIWTSLPTPNIYILEPIQKRICVVDKKGKLVKEYKDDNWNDLRDFAVGSDGSIYILDSNKIYKIKE